MGWIGSRKHRALNRIQKACNMDRIGYGKAYDISLKENKKEYDMTEIVYKFIRRGMDRLQ